jgi:hypothetical protein
MKNRIRTALVLTVLLAAGAPGGAQFAPVADVGQAAFSHMHTLLQKTLLKVDVLTVDICFDAETAGRLAPLGARTRLSGAGADSVTRAVLDGEHARARVLFLRDVALEDFLDGARADLWHAVKAGLLEEADYRVLEAGLPGWYSPLARRGIRKGDQILYDMGPEVIRTVFLRREGTAALEHTVSGRGLRNSPLATWLARGSSFRSGLLESLRHDARRVRQPGAADRCGASGN